ncbi:MAG: hypothetical protein ACC645_15605 [Pirellulales bacterium]
MVLNEKRCRVVVASLIVATGLAVVWALLSVWGATLATQAFLSHTDLQERIQIAAEGTPVVITQAGANNLDLGRRTLGGKQWPVVYEKWLAGARLVEPAMPPGLVQVPLPWRGRVAGGSDGKHPPTAWYLLCNAEPEGKVYLAGFDAVSNLPAGYIGRQGFRSTIPPPDQQFSLPKNSRYYLSSVCKSPQFLQSWGIVQSWNHKLDEESQPPAWLVFLIGEDRLVEIDLRKRTVRTALEIPGVQTITSIGWWKPKSKESSDTVLAPTTSDNAPADLELINRYALRTGDRVVVYDPASGDHQAYVIPEELRRSTFSAFRLGPDRLLYQVGRGFWSGGTIVDLLWSDADGRVEEEQRIELASSVPMPQKQMARSAAAVVPVPLVWLTGMTLFYPATKLQQHHADDYGYTDALLQAMEIGWQPLIVVLVIGLIVAGLALRLHRKYYRPRPGVWWLFVFLLGPAGLLAYWLEHRRAVLEPCAACGHTVPRDRDGCAACGETFAPPAPVGTEVFA